MARPRKCRKVCFFPDTVCFQAENMLKRDAIVLSIDEYECLRLIDREGLSQADCALQMDVARTTIQLIYASARKKLADMLVEGRPLHIEGGDYQLCPGGQSGIVCGKCSKYVKNQKGDNTMKIAVTYENGQVFQHFGHTAQFKVYEIADGKVSSSEVVDTMGQGHGALAGVLNVLNVDALICGGIGMGAQNALRAAGIKFYAGVSGLADDAVQAYLAGALDYDPNTVCNHHSEGHNCGEHGAEHNCAHHDHSCGGHSCH